MSALTAAALVVLILLPAAASGVRAPASGRNTTGVLARLTVSITGTGSGWVTSDPAGINCPTTCSAEFPITGPDITVCLYPTPAIGSTFSGWGDWGLIHEPNCGFLYPSGDWSVNAIFVYTGPPGPPCTVPRVEGRALTRAKALIEQNHCKVGKLKYAFSHKIPKGRVISQSPPATWQGEQGAKVKLVVSKGRR